MDIAISKSLNLKAKPASSSLGFGKYFTDHMFLARYSSEQGWHQAEILPYGPLPLEPGASVLHYGQALFEGMKAFRQPQGDCVLFRPEFNWQRLVQGAERLCMQAPPKDLFVKGIESLIQIDRDWIPAEKNCALYIRPTLIGTESFLGVRPSDEYLFFVILSPVGSYYGADSEVVKIWVEDQYVRAAPGGLGATKAAANYASSLKAAHTAKQKGFSQVLWLDVSREHIEEVGTMNVFFVFDNEIITPSLDGSILGGGVRDSVITLLQSWGLKVSQRKVKIQEVLQGLQSGALKEIFGTGTAAVITPVGELGSTSWSHVVNKGKRGSLSQKLFDELTAIQLGFKPDSFQWLHKIS